MEKETKFNLLIFSNFENSRKRVELEQILKTLEIERLQYERQIDELNLNIKARDSDVLKKYVRERVRNELGLGEEMGEVEVLEKCIERLRVKEKKDLKAQRLEEELQHVLGEKELLEKRMEQLRLQKNPSPSPQ